MIKNFNDLYAKLKADGICKRMVAAWAIDSHTIEACSKAADLGFVKVTLVGDEEIVIDTPPGYTNARVFFDSRLENYKLYLKPLSCEFLIIDL